MDSVRSSPASFNLLIVDYYYAVCVYKTQPLSQLYNL